MTYTKRSKTTLDQHIGVRIPGGQPVFFSIAYRNLSQRI
jgi:hypothetical protein